MKNEKLIITAIVFFFLINTSYYWEGKLGLFAFPVFLLLSLIYVILAVGLLIQIFHGFKEKFKNKNRLYRIILIMIVLGLTFIKPTGLIEFDTFEGKDLFVVYREGAANCMTAFKLKENNKFIEKNICFGITEIKGNYFKKGDTIFFENVELGRHESEYYKFGVIKSTTVEDGKTRNEFVRYKNYGDTVGHKFWITDKDLAKYKKIK